MTRIARMADDGVQSSVFGSQNTAVAGCARPETESRKPAFPFVCFVVVTNREHFGGRTMSRISIEEAQAKLSELISQLQPGEELEITKDHETVAKLVR